MKRTQGSAHVVIIVSLVAALLAALGIVFYQNFLANKVEPVDETSVAKKSAEQTDDASSAALTNVAMNDVFTPGINFSYPSSWSATHSTQGPVPPVEMDMTTQTYIVTSADKAVDVSVALSSGGGFGGTCNPDEVNTLDVFDTTTIPGLDGYSYIQGIYQNPYQSNQWVVVQGMGMTTEAAKIGAGSSSCTIPYMMIPSLPKMTNVASNSARINVNISRHGTDEMIGYDTLAQAKVYLASDTAKSVKNTLLSMRY